MKFTIVKWLKKATFALTDQNGHPINSSPKLGDYIKIRIPGIPNVRGNGYDWVRIIQLENISEENLHIHILKVKPSTKPPCNHLKIDHFLTDQASNTFIIACNPEFIQISVHGRNEVINVKDEVDLFHKIRNHLTASGGFMGFNSIQWQSLIEGILRLA